MNDTDGQGQQPEGDKIDHDDGTQRHPSPFQVRTMEMHL